MRFLCNLYLLLFLTGTLVFAGDEVDLFQVAREGNATQMREMIASGADLKQIYFIPGKHKCARQK
jgi:hypothetical protein